MGLRIHPRLAWQVLDGQAVLVELDTGQAIGLNRTGSFVWPRLQDESASEIVDALTREFAVDPATARADLDAFLDMLRRRNLIEGEPP